MRTELNSIFLLTTGLGKGGAELQLVILAEYWASVGCDVTLVSLTPLEDPLYRMRLDASAVRVVHLGMKSGADLPAVLWRLIRLLRRGSPAVLLSFMVHANLLGRLAGRLAGVPHIVSSIRNMHFGGGVREAAIRVTDRLGHISTTNSVLAAHSLVERRIVPADRLVVVPNILSAQTLVILDDGERRALRTELGADDSAFLWLTVGSLTDQKDHANLLDAMGRLDISHRLVIAGDGPLQETLQGRIDRGLADRVRLLGQRDDVPRLLAAADAFVLSSDWEGLPNVVMEAQGAGLPVVSTEVGGVSELVENGVSGFLVRARQDDLLAQAMERLAALEPKTRAKMGETGRTAVGRFGLESVVALWEEVLAG